MIKKVAAFMKRHQMLPENGHILAGVSGGADSVCLFRLLLRLREEMGFTLSVVHVEHGIRGEESLMDMEFVRRLASSHGIAFSSYACLAPRLAKERGISLEEAGREARYEAFAAESARFGDGARVALAHHMEDNAETVLFHMCRGSGMAGIAGIAPVRGNIIRPLLCVTRAEIEDFLRREGQPFRTDATNADVAYTRNRIRGLVMPELTRVNQKAAQHIARLSREAAELSAYLGERAEEALRERVTLRADGTILFWAEGLLEYPSALLTRMMLELIAKACGRKKDISREHADALLDLALGGTGRRLSLPYGITAVKGYGTLTLGALGTGGGTEGFSFMAPAGASEYDIRVPNGTFFCRILENHKKDVNFPKNRYTKWFDCDRIKNRLSFRVREPGDYFVLDAQGRRQKLKEYWINEKVPKEERGEIPLVADGSHILWAVGHRISEYYKISQRTMRILEVRFMEEDR